MNSPHYQEMISRVEGFFVGDMLNIEEFATQQTYERLARVMLCVEVALTRSLPEGQQHWFVVTSVKALRAAYHGMRESEATHLPGWPTFASEAPATDLIRRCTLRLLGVDMRIDNDETTVMLFNMKQIRYKGYRLSHMKFTEPLNLDEI